MLPVLRVVLSAWGVLFAALALGVSLAGMGEGVGRVVSPLIFCPLGLWAAWRWWHLGAVVGRDDVRFQGLWRSRTVTRQTITAVRVGKRRPSWRRRFLLGDWFEHEVILDTATGRCELGTFGLAFQTDLGAESFVERLRSALAEQSNRAHTS